MNLRVVMALNMFDELRAKGDELDIKTLGHLLGMPIVPTVSKTGEGIDGLFDKVIELYENPSPEIARHIHINHGQELEQSIDRVKIAIQKNQGHQVQVFDEVSGHKAPRERQGGGGRHRHPTEQGRDNSHKIRRAEEVRIPDGHKHRIGRRGCEVRVRERRPGRDMEAGDGEEEAPLHDRPHRRDNHKQVAGFPNLLPHTVHSVLRHVHARGNTPCSG